MIERLDKDLKERINKAITNARLIATRVKRASVLDASQRAETVVNLLNAFRQYVNANEGRDVPSDRDAPFKHDRETAAKVVQAIFQIDTVFSYLTREKKKSYEQEHRQVWNLLENIHTYTEMAIKKDDGNG